jgi:hypothetical protein
MMAPLKNSIFPMNWVFSQFEKEKSQHLLGF